MIPCAALDSVPADINAYLAIKELKQKYNTDAKEVRSSVIKVKGVLSAGTLHSCLQVINSKLTRKYNSLYSLSPVKGLQKSLKFLYYDKMLGGWLGPWIMEESNAKIVMRSWGIREQGNGSFKYGPNMHFYERLRVANIAITIFSTIAISIFFILAIVPPSRWLMKKIIPAGKAANASLPGEKGKFEYRTVALPDIPPNSKHDEVPIIKVELKVDLDPYTFSAVMLAQAALCILKQTDVIPATTELGVGGIWTPSTALGQFYVNRLKNQGCTFIVDQVISSQ